MKVGNLLILFAFLLLYIVIGGVLFRSMEANNEVENRNQSTALIRQFLDDHPCVSKEDLQVLLNFAITKFQEGVIATDNKTEASTWSLHNAVFFSVTVVTTIGYGNISPSTTTGQIFCLIYAVFGIPLCLIFLGEVGGKIHQQTRKLAKKMCVNMVKGKVHKRPVKRSVKRKGRRTAKRQGSRTVKRQGSRTVKRQGSRTVEGQVNRTMDGEVEGQVNRVEGQIKGQVNGMVERRVKGQVEGQVNGAVEGLVKRTVEVMVNGEFNRTVEGQVEKEVTGQVNRAVEGICFIVIGVIMFVLIPAIIFTHIEKGWNYGHSVYYAVITLTTIGFGEFVAGQNIDKNQEWYRTCISIWILLGLAWMATVLSVVQDSYRNLMADPKPNGPPRGKTLSKREQVDSFLKSQSEQPEDPDTPTIVIQRGHQGTRKIEHSTHM